MLKGLFIQGFLKKVSLLIEFLVIFLLIIQLQAILFSRSPVVKFLGENTFKIDTINTYSEAFAGKNYFGI